MEFDVPLYNGLSSAILLSMGPVVTNSHRIPSEFTNNESPSMKYTQNKTTNSMTGI